MPLMHWSQAYFPLGPHTRVLQTLSCCFDFGIFEILSTVLFGGTLIFPQSHELKNLESYGDLVSRHQVNTLHSTPSIVRQILALGATLETVSCLHLGGEPIPETLSRAIFEATSSTSVLHNGYGPTEVTVNSTIFTLTAGSDSIPAELPIGRATAQTSVHVLGRQDLTLDQESDGELCLGGLGIARGYLHRPSLTALRFVPDPFSDQPGCRLYKSGDRVCYLPEGHLKFLGRFDHQVKIRGYRVEVGEIENALVLHPEVHEAVVLPQGTDGCRRLVAFLLPPSGLSPTSGSLRRHLKKSLPDHMLPAKFHVMPSFPLGPSGKTDLLALTHMAEEGSEEHEALPDLARAFDEQGNLTVNQSLFWFTHKLQAGHQLYYDRTPVRFTIEGAIDLFHFCRAFQRVVDASDTLRSRFLEVDGLPRRLIHQELAVEVDEVDLSQDDDPEEALQSWLQERRNHPMDLEHQLFDCVLVKLAPKRTVWYLNLFHILADAWSIALIFRHTAEGYALSLKGHVDEVPDMVPFQEFVELDRTLRSSPRYEKAEGYWRGKLASPLVPSRFFLTGMTPATDQTFRMSLDLGVERSTLIRGVSREQGFFSPAVPFAAVLFAYLHRLNGRSPLRIGTPFANRQPHFRDCIGLFMTVCPTQVEIAPRETFFTLARKAQLEIARTTRFEFFPVRNPASNPAYDVHLNYQNISFPEFSGMPSRFELLMAGRSNDRLDVQVRDFDGSGSFFLDFDFNRGHFNEKQGQLAIGHYLCLLDILLSNGDQEIDRAEMLSGEEQQGLLAMSAAAAQHWSNDKGTEGSRLYVLDPWLNLLPEGVVGEVYMAKLGTDPNGPVPIPSPFDDPPNASLVTTGSRGRWSQGLIEVVAEGLETEVRTLEDESPFTSPRSDLEAALAEVYAVVLDTAQVSVFEDFFSLGGNSLLAAQLVLALRRKLERPIPLGWVFESPTVAELGKRIELDRLG
jgi:non-ribosomal peptide synthetase component F